MNITLIEAYQILGINANTTLEEARAAYHLAVKKTHPDSFGENEDIRRVNAAFELVEKIIKNKQELDLSEIKKTQEAARAKAQAKAREQVRREEERKRNAEAERLRQLKKVYSELMQSSEFKKQNISEEEFLKNNDNPECAKWASIHYYASSIHHRREKYIKDYAASIDEKNASINGMVPFTSLHPNPIAHNKKQAYRTMMNQKYGTIGDAISTVYTTLAEEINHLSKCLDFSDTAIMSYLIGDEKYQNKIKKKAENRLAAFYKIAKYIASKPECFRELDEAEFLRLSSTKYQAEIIRMKNIESYVSHVYIFDSEGNVTINNDNITRSEYQIAREWLNVIKANNRSKVERSTIVIYINYVAGCLGFIYERIPHPEFNPNVKPDKLLELAKVIKSLEKYYLIAQEDGITDCYNAYLKIKNNPVYKDLKLIDALNYLLELNKKRKIINRYYLHSYYSLEEIANMTPLELDELYRRALSYEEEITEYKAKRPDIIDLVELYLKKLKDNKKFAPLFSDDVTFTEIMRFLESKKRELDCLAASEKPSLATYIFLSDKELADLRMAPIYESKKNFIVNHNEDYSNKNFQAIKHSDINYELVNPKKEELNSMTPHQIDQIYRRTVIDFLNANHPRYEAKKLDNASYGRLDRATLGNLIAEAEDAVTTKLILAEIQNGGYQISEEDVISTTPSNRIKLLKSLVSERNKTHATSSPYTKK